MFDCTLPHIGETENTSREGIVLHSFNIYDFLICMRKSLRSFSLEERRYEAVVHQQPSRSFQRTTPVRMQSYVIHGTDRAGACTRA